jgi:hypothetical protein
MPSILLNVVPASDVPFSMGKARLADRARGLPRRRVRVRQLDRWRDFEEENVPLKLRSGASNQGLKDPLKPRGVRLFGCTLLGI